METIQKEGHLPDYQKPLPVDPSNTHPIGQPVEQGVVDVHKGISEQASEWEDEQERSVRQMEEQRKLREQEL